MTLDVDIQDAEESVLPRTEYTLSVSYDGATPTRHDVKEQAHLLIDDDQDKLIIRSFPETMKGTTFTVKARQYHDDSAMRLLEHEDMIAKNTARNDSDDEDES